MKLTELVKKWNTDDPTAHSQVNLTKKLCAKELESHLNSETEKSDCGHPRKFGKFELWENPPRQWHCTLCAEVQAAYERGKRDAETVLERREAWIREAKVGGAEIDMLAEFDKAEAEILALKDRGAK
jgi:hypothetical protein